MTASISVRPQSVEIYPEPDADLSLRLDIAARGQLIEVPTGAYDWIRLHLDRASTDQAEVEDTVWLHYRDGVDREWMRVTVGARTCRIPVPRHAELVAFRLPERDGLWLRGLTLIPTPAGVSRLPHAQPGESHAQPGDDQQ
jgi:hypothetical protein